MAMAPETTTPIIRILRALFIRRVPSTGFPPFGAWWVRTTSTTRTTVKPSQTSELIWSPAGAFRQPTSCAGRLDLVRPQLICAELPKGRRRGVLAPRHWVERLRPSPGPALRWCREGISQSSLSTVCIRCFHGSCDPTGNGPYPGDDVHLAHVSSLALGFARHRFRCTPSAHNLGSRQKQESG